MRHRLPAAAVAMTVVLLLGSGARAASPTDELRGFFVTATNILDDPATGGRPEERLRAIFGAVREIFDFPGAARLSLGAAWTARTQAEREEFVRLFADLLERSFVFGIAGRVQLGDGVRVSYLEESVAGDDATVRTTIESRRGLDLPFTYRMVERGQGWAIRDVVIDGVSVAANYRAQFARILQTSSYADLIRQMRARVSPAPLGEPEVAMAEDLAASPADAAPELAERETLAPRPPSPIAPLASEPDARDPLPPSPIAALATDPPEREPVRPASPAAEPRVEPIPAMPVEAETPARPWSAARDRLAREEAAAGRVSIGERPTTAEPAPAAAPPAVSLEPDRSPAPRAAGRTSYWVQVGAFRDPEGARRLAEALLGHAPPGPDAWPVVLDRSEAPAALTRVRVGPFAHRADATAHLRALEAHGYQPFMARERD